MRQETPIVCDMSGASDTGPQRLAEFQRLFVTHLVARERTADGIRFRLRADDGVEAWVRDLATREKACCAFFDFHITVNNGQVLWHASVIDNDIARAILDEFYALPDSKPDTANELADRMTAKGLHFTNRPGTAITEVHHTGTFGLSG